MRANSCCTWDTHAKRTDAAAPPRRAERACVHSHLHCAVTATPTVPLRDGVTCDANEQTKPPSSSRNSRAKSDALPTQTHATSWHTTDPVRAAHRRPRAHPALRLHVCRPPRAPPPRLGSSLHSTPRPRVPRALPTLRGPSLTSDRALLKPRCPPPARRNSAPADRTVRSGQPASAHGVPPRAAHAARLLPPRPQRKSCSAAPSRGSRLRRAVVLPLPDRRRRRGGRGRLRGGWGRRRRGYAVSVEVPGTRGREGG